jgi:glucokinase
MFDGYAATLGEATFGAGRGYDSVATLIIGTGFGAGVWLDGRVIEGQTAVAGAVGWDRWPLADGSLSDPAEAIASGAGILAEARRTGRQGEYPDTAAVFRRASEGDPAARAAVDSAATVAGTIAGHIIDLLAPQLVVWSGGVGSRADFSQQATAVARRSCQPYASTRTQFTSSGLGAESSLVGAAARALSIAKGEDPG